MNRKRTIFRNATASALQVVVNAAVLFVLYPFLIRSVGAEDFGVWALVMAWTSAGSLASMGLSSGALKFTARYLALGDTGRVVSVVQTAALSVTAALGAVLLLAYPAFAFFLEQLFEHPATAATAHSILPAAFVSFWLLSISGVFISAIDGCHRMALRSYLMMAASLLYLTTCLIAVPRAGLIGLVGAQVLQYLVLTAGAWLILRRLLPALPPLPLHWHRDTFREMLGYSLNFQAISLFMVLLEPVAKSLIARFAGVAVVTPFETAHKMVLQIRSVVITAYTAVVPSIAHLQEQDPARIRAVYSRSYRLLLLFVLVALPGLIAATPIVSRLWLGAYDGTFVIFAALLLAGWFLNILTAPAYYAYVGTGRLRWNVLGHAVTGLLNLVLGLLLGRAYGGPGVVAGFTVALIAGSFLVTIMYEREHRLSAWKLIGPENVALGLASGAGTALALFLYVRFDASLSLPWLVLLVASVFLAIVLLPLLRHPEVQRLHASVTNRTLRKLGPHKPATSDA